MPACRPNVRLRAAESSLPRLISRRLIAEPAWEIAADKLSAQAANHRDIFKASPHSFTPLIFPPPRWLIRACARDANAMSGMREIWRGTSEGDPPRGWRPGSEDFHDNWHLKKKKKMSAHLPLFVLSVKRAGVLTNHTAGREETKLRAGALKM